MVTCKLYGGIGNMMFQIAATIGTAAKNDDTYSIPYKSIKFGKMWDNPFIHLPFINKQVKKTYNEKRLFVYDEIKYNGDICLDGYFQSTKYFSHCVDRVKKEFDFIKSGIDLVSIHVRRGDYLKKKDQFPVIDLEYISHATDYFMSLGFNRFLVFSDDIEWCKATLPILEDREFNFSENETPFYDMKIMACCKHNILSPSTFGWWAAYLNANPEKIVICPKIWNLKHEVNELIPEDWIRI